VSAFRSDDFPTLRRPNMPKWSRKLLGVVCMGSMGEC
jgi:hypothetical protein